MHQTLRQESNKIKEKFLKLLPKEMLCSDCNSRETIVVVDRKRYQIEIKSCHSNSINQVRAIRFQTLIIYNSGEWYVIPPQEVVKLVAQKSRGQHNEISFECANISLNKIESNFKCLEFEIPDKVALAIRIGYGEKHRKIREKMNELSAELEKLNERYLNEMQQLFSI